MTDLINIRNCKIIIFTVAVLLYSNTITNQYALDDSIAVSENEYVQQGLQGIPKILNNDSFTGFFKEKKQLIEGGRYRPLSLITFAIEHQLWGNKPGISHGINALLYGLLCILLFTTFIRILNFLTANSNTLVIAFLASLLFALHPVHTEVVANIKGRDELLAILFLLAALNTSISGIIQLTIPKLLLTGVFIFIALLAKEHAIFILPILFILLLLGRRPLNWKNILLLTGSIGVGVSLYIVLRHAAVGSLVSPGSDELMNNPYLHASTGQKLPTILYSLLIYFKLLFVPHPLTYDYYPYHIALQNWKSGWVLISVVIHLALVVIAVVSFRKRKVLSFGILFYLLTLLPMTNLLVNIGSFMNERFLFLPSIGFSLAAACLLHPYIIRKPVSFINIFLLVVALLFSIKTISRNTHWKNNYTLFTHDVHISKGSAKANCTAGGVLYEKAVLLSPGEKRNSMLKQSINYLDEAVRIYPEYVDALLLLGNAHYELNSNLHAAEQMYFQIFKLAPNYQPAYNNYKKILKRHTVPTERISGYLQLHRKNPGDYEVLYQLGTSYGKMLHNFDSATYYLNKSVKMRPGNATANRDLGVAYAMSGNFEKSLPYLIKADSIRPNDRENLINLGMTYQNLGNISKAQLLFKRAEGLKGAPQTNNPN